MKPVLILQNQSTDGPAYLGRWLAERGVPSTVVDFHAGGVAPSTLDGHGALALLGGEMSANDDLPSLRQSEALFRLALRDGVPTIGHCLGGQLMARALGARVARAPVPEIGWQRLTVLQTPTALRWFGTSGERTVLQWHFDAFAVPPGAELLASSSGCAHQAFAVGPHLAMQFHVEVDSEKLTRWAMEGSMSHRHAAAAHPNTVQDGSAMLANAQPMLRGQQAWADRIYGRWLAQASER